MFFTGESYTVSFDSGTEGMFGSNAGTWTGDGLACSESGAGQTGRYAGSGCVLCFFLNSNNLRIARY